MPDDSELDYIQTFLEEVTTLLIVETFETKRKIKQVTTAKKCLVEPGQFLNVDGAFFTKRYKIKLSVANEIIMTSIINEIIDGIIVYNKGATGLTKVSVMCNLKLVYTNKSYIENGIWLNDLFIDIEWVTS